MRTTLTMKFSFRDLSSARLLTLVAGAALLAVVPAISAQGAYPPQYGAQPGYGAPQQGYGDPQQGDPPSRVGRLSTMQGNVSFQPANASDFSAAEMNYPLTSGDRLYTDTGALTEVESGQLAVRLGQQTDFTVSELDDQYAQFGLGQGSLVLRTYALDTPTEVDTPNASITVVQPGSTRVDYDPNSNMTTVRQMFGQSQVNAQGVQQVLNNGQVLRIFGDSPARSQFDRMPRPDALDSFSGRRDALFQQASQSQSNYIDSDTIGYADLSAYGSWDSSPDYGPVWYPRNVAGDWAPYSDGHWVSIEPWGWTWVGAEPWGFAPYHYGRWNRFGNRWGWIPGPPQIRPVYSPALVVFVGGPTFSVGGFSLTLGGGGVTAWFPLGPREVYRPWYRSSTVYVNRVNVTNIYNRNPVEVRNIYNDRRDRFADAQRNYANRNIATVAIPQRSFGSGRPVRESMVKGDQRQFQNAPILQRPPAPAPQQQGGGRPPARVMPPNVQRPTLDTRNSPRGPRNDGDRGGFNGGRPNNAPGQPARDSNDNGGRFNNNGNGFGRGQGQPNQPVQPAAPVAPAQPAAPDRGNDNRDRFNNNGNGFGRGDRQPNQPAPVVQPAPVAPAAPAAPVAPPDRGNGGRFNGNGGNGNGNGRGQGQPNQPAPVPAAPQPAPAAPAAPIAPERGNGNGGRFNGNNGNGRDQGQPNQPAPAPVPPAVPRPAPPAVVTPPPAPAAPTAPAAPDRGNGGRFNNGGNGGGNNGNGNGFGRGQGQPAPAPAQPAAPPAPPVPPRPAPERAAPPPQAQPAPQPQRPAVTEAPRPAPVPAQRPQPVQVQPRPHPEPPPEDKK